MHSRRMDRFPVGKLKIQIKSSEHLLGTPNKASAPTAAFVAVLAQCQVES